MLRSTRPPRHSRVCSPTMDTILIGRPSVVASNWKSTAHTTFGASAVGGFGAVGRAETLAPASLRHAQALVAPEPLDLLVVDVPALGAGVVVGRTKPTPRMVPCPVPQPRAQPGVRVGRCRRGWRPPLGRSVLPGHAAGEPLTHLHRPHQVVHGRPPALRAQRFPFAISLSAALSSSASASSRLSVAFSRSRSLSRLASSAFIPPNWLRHR
jgi:hypothetical protein